MESCPVLTSASTAAKNCQMPPRRAWRSIVTGVGRQCPWGPARPSAHGPWAAPERSRGFQHPYQFSLKLRSPHRPLGRAGGFQILLVVQAGPEFGWVGPRTRGPSRPGRRILVSSKSGCNSIQTTVARNSRHVCYSSMLNVNFAMRFCIVG